MIRVVVHQRSGLLEHLEVSGHAPAAGGAESAPCAAVSAVVRALGLVLVRSPHCTVSGSAADPGYVDLTVENVGDAAWLAGAWDVAWTALQDAARTWPGEIQIKG